MVGVFVSVGTGVSVSVGIQVPVAERVTEESVEVEYVTVTLALPGSLFKTVEAPAASVKLTALELTLPTVIVYEPGEVMSMPKLPMVNFAVKSALQETSRPRNGSIEARPRSPVGVLLGVLVRVGVLVFVADGV